MISQDIYDTPPPLLCCIAPRWAERTQKQIYWADIPRRGQEKVNVCETTSAGRLCDSPLPKEESQEELNKHPQDQHLQKASATSPLPKEESQEE